MNILEKNSTISNSFLVATLFSIASSIVIWDLVAKMLSNHSDLLFLLAFGHQHSWALQITTERNNELI